jgi:hypothetical protein
MYKYYYCKHINDKFYDSKININNLSSLIDKYNLELKKHIKEYWINNVQVISNKDNIEFYKISDKEIKYENNYIIQEYIIENCQPFNFNDVHSEEEYILYENTINNIKIILKKYTEYITLEFKSENLINNDNFLYYNII